MLHGTLINYLWTHLKVAIELSAIAAAHQAHHMLIAAPAAQPTNSSRDHRLRLLWSKLLADVNVAEQPTHQHYMYELSTAVEIT